MVSAENEFLADILIEDGKIKEIGKDLNRDEAEVIDAEGMYVLPGGVDQHVHFSFEFKGEKVQGFETSKAAAIGGTTTVIEFVNQVKGQGLLESIDDYRMQFAEGVAMVDFAFHAVATDPTAKLWADLPKMAEAGYPTIKLFMAYKGLFFHADDDTIAKCMDLGKEYGISVMIHAENADIIDYLQQKCIDEGHYEPYYHAVSRPPMVEVEATERAINIAKTVGAPLYVVHVTTKGAIKAIQKAQADGLPVYGETCTHYLLLDKSDLARDGFEGAKYVCSPALREEEDREYLWKAIKNNWLNAVASDHCAFNWNTQKIVGDRDFRDIPNGAPGMENRLGLLWTYGVGEGRISRSDLVRLYASNPAKNNGLDYCKGSIEIGYDADIVIYNPEGEYTISAENSLQGVDYNSFEGMVQKGRVETVLLRGEIIVENNKYIGYEGQGKFIKCKPYGMIYR